MKNDPENFASRNLLLTLLGVCAGAGLLLYLRHRRTEAGSAAEASALPAGFREPQPGDILLFHNARGMNKLITGFTRSPFYHVGLYAGEGKAVEARTPGVIRDDLRDRKNDFVTVPAPEGKGKAALRWAEAQIGDAYDDLDIAVIILDRLCRFLRFNYTPRDKFTCGEFVATAFDKADAPLFPERDLGSIVPADFAPLAPDRTKQITR